MQIDDEIAKPIPIPIANEIATQSLHTINQYSQYIEPDKSNK